MDLYIKTNSVNDAASLIQRKWTSMGGARRRGRSNHRDGFMGSRIGKFRPTPRTIRHTQQAILNGRWPQSLPPFQSKK